MMALPGGCAGEWWQFWVDPGCADPHITPLAGAVAGLAADSIFTPWVQDAKQGVQDVIKTMITFWIDIPDPDIGTPQGVVNPVITFLQDRLVWMGAVIMSFVILYNVIQMMWERDKAKPLVDVGKMVGIYLGTAVMAIPAFATALLVTNWVAQTILELSTAGNTNFADNVFSLFNSDAGVASGILLILVFIIAMVIAGLMCIIMIGRGAAFFVILGGLLTQASGYATPSGKEGFWTSVGWIKGLLLYKVVAAAIFGVGFKFLSTNPNTEGNGLLQMLYGLTLILMAVFSLPATMRITAPATSPVASGSGVGGSIAGAAPMLAAGMLRR
jgi:type IV secretion system protein TrbL